MVVRPGAPLEDRVVRDLPELLAPGDQLVVNDTRVIPASLHGRRIGREPETRIEANLHKRLDGARWLAFVKPARRLRAGDVVRFGDEGKVASSASSTRPSRRRRGRGGGLCVLVPRSVLDQAIAERGEMPLPPYSRRAAPPDATTAPTTRHCSPTTKARSRRRPRACISPTTRGAAQARGIGMHTVTLHVGAGTFLPVKAEDHRGSRDACGVRHRQRGPRAH